MNLAFWNMHIYHQNSTDPCHMLVPGIRAWRFGGTIIQPTTLCNQSSYGPKRVGQTAIVYFLSLCPTAGLWIQAQWWEVSVTAG